MRKTVFFISVILLASNFHVKSQSGFESTEDFFKASFPGEVSVTHSDNSNSYSCIEDANFMQITVCTYPYKEMQENGKMLLNVLKKGMIQLIPYNTIDSIEIDFKGYPCHKVEIKGVMDYDMYIFTAYDKIFLLQYYGYQGMRDEAKVESFINSFDIINENILKEQRKQYEESVKKTQEMINRKEEYKKQRMQRGQ